MIKSSLIRFCIVAILVSTGFQSCYKDKGNYDYHDINELTITGINSYYQLRQGDVLKISPTITGSLTAFNEDDYDY